MQKQTSLSFSLLVLSVLVLPNCDFGSKSKVTENTESKTTTMADDVLLKIDGKPVITKESFEKYKENFAKAQPQYAAMLA